MIAIARRYAALATCEPQLNTDPDILGPMASGEGRDVSTNATTQGPRDAAVKLTIGERIADRYVVRSFLGEGGMGAVYRALDETLGEDVALKVIRGSVGQMARDEVRIAQKVTHANVCRTYDLEEAGAHHFVKMELVEGETLAARLARSGTLEISEAVRIALAIADGLAAAHAKGIVHRDLKPGNVMLSGDRVVLMDFGIAHLVGPAEGLAGTIGYMAPEQLTERQIDGRADLYALGCVLYEMLAGAPVFGNAKQLELVDRHVSAIPFDIRISRPEVPSWLARSLVDLLAKAPERRDAGVARLRVGYRSPLRIVVPIAVVIAAAVAGVMIWRASRVRTWQPELVHFEAYEEDGTTTSISPDGAWFVFDSDRALRDNMRLYVMSRATGETIALATPPGIDVVSPQWTRDGTAILYEAIVPGGDHIYRQRVAGTPPALSGPPEDLGNGVEPAPCGDAIVYLDSGPVTKRVMLLATDGSRRALATIEHNEAVETTRCDPSGDHVVFVSGSAAFEDSGNDIYVVDRNGVTQQLTTDHATSSAMFTADGRSIVFAANHGGTRDLFEIPATGGVPRPLLVGDAGRAADVSRDGRLVVFHRDDSSIFPAIGDGTAARRITSRRGNYFWPKPAGPDRIVARRAAGASSEIVTIRLSDGAITVLARGYTGFPSLDNTRVYFRLATPSGLLMVVPIGGGPATEVATLPGTIMFGFDGPDGQHLAVETGVGKVDAYRVVNGHPEPEGAHGLVTVAPTGGWRAVTELFTKTGGNTNARLLLIPPGAELSAPSKELAVASVYNVWLDDHRIEYCGDGSCHVLDVTTNTTKTVPVYPKFYEHGAIVMPDGKHVVDSFGVTRITRHAITNFQQR